MKSLSCIFLTVLFLQSFVPLYAQDALYCLELEQTKFEQFDVLNQDIEDKKIILLGEHHYMAANTPLQTDLFIHLNKQVGVRHLLIEFGRAEAYLYNQYLQTGDEKYLNKTFAGFSRYKEFFPGWRKLYAYNAGLDSGKKMVVHGLDIEREPGLSASMYALLSAYENNPSVSSLRDAIKLRLDTIGIERDTKEYTFYLREKIAALSLPDGENKKSIDYILGNNSFFSNFMQRDKYMEQTFLELDTTDEVYLGQFGFGHTQMNNGEYLAGLLSKHEKYQNKILIMNMYYMDSGKAHALNDLADCPVFLYKFDLSDDKLGAFGERGQWAIILKDQKRYSQIE
ncbi:hypothetical protein D770_22765 [Flammeovirgaceae bacterium 311]|nr:hypothetical protein D770_22765 [Flammeovirgaceae bacterium 311]